MNNFGTLTNQQGDFGSFVANYGTLNNSGTLSVNGSSSAMDNRGTLNNSGTLSLNGNSWMNFGAINNSGTLNSGSSATIYAGGTLNNSGTLNHTSGALENRGQITNSGQFVTFAGAVVTGGGTYTQTAGTTRVDGSMTQGAVNINGGVLQGVGTITAPVTNNGGILAPGNSPGTLTIVGNYTQTALGTFQAEIGGLTAGTQHELLAIFGTATLAGTLNVLLYDLGSGIFSPARRRYVRHPYRGRHHRQLYHSFARGPWCGTLMAGVLPA